MSYAFLRSRNRAAVVRFMCRLCFMSAVMDTMLSNVFLPGRKPLCCGIRFCV